MEVLLQSSREQCALQHTLFSVHRIKQDTDTMMHCYPQITDVTHFLDKCMHLKCFRIFDYHTRL